MAKRSELPGPVVSVRMVLGFRGCPECPCPECREAWGKVPSTIETLRLPGLPMGGLLFNTDVIKSLGGSL